jgi:GT2 family glycosyltransferase
MRPKVSFIVTVYNKEPYLPELVGSVLDQMPAGAAEWIFVDDGSRDGSVALLEGLRAGLPPDDQARFHILRTPRNGGPGPATNLGWRAATGEFFHVVDGDDRLPRNATAAMIAQAEWHRADIVFGRYAPMGPERGEVPADAPVRVDEDAFLGVVRRRLQGTRYLASLDLVRRTGGADESIFIADCTMPWRIAAASRRLVFIDAAVLEYRLGAADQMSGNRAQETHDLIASALLVLREHPSASPRAARILRRRCLERLAKHGRQNWAAAEWLPVFGLSLAAALPGVAPARIDAILSAGTARIAGEGRVRRPGQGAGADADNLRVSGPGGLGFDRERA